MILAGLQDTLVPRQRWDRDRRQHVISAETLRDERRKFYVALTRARYQVFLLSSPSWTNTYGYRVRDGRSRFVSEIELRLARQ